MRAGYLEAVDAFAATAFGFTDKEATDLDPQQRIGLEIAAEALANAGYGFKGLQGSRTSVYASIEPSLYLRGVANPTDTQRLGTIANMFPARVAHLFGLQGPAATVDSACSSSLLALHLACNDLKLDQSDFGLVVATNIHPLPFQLPSDGMRSNDGLSRSYSDLAAGMSYGEAAVAVLVKRLDAAIADGDVIHAVIAGSAAIHNGGRSFSLTAPDSEAIADVLHRAWRQSGHKLDDVEYLEGHGAGTKLGDTLEIEGYVLATRGLKRDCLRRPYLVSAAKSAVGHAQTASGLTSLTRAVLAIREGEIFPTPLADPLSTMINFAQKGIKIATSAQSFSSEERLVGVTNLGLSGTSVHIVLKSAPKRISRQQSGRRPFLISASSSAELHRELQHSRAWLGEAQGKIEFADVCFTSLVNGGGADGAHWATSAIDFSELLRSVDAEIARLEHSAGRSKVGATERVLFVMDGEESCANARDRLTELQNGCSSIATVLETIRTQCNLDWNTVSNESAAFAWKTALFIALRDEGVNIEIVPIGRGRTIAAAVANRTTLPKALAEWTAMPPSPLTDYVRIAARLIEAVGRAHALIVLPSCGNSLEPELRERTTENISLAVLDHSVSDLVSAVVARILCGERPVKAHRFAGWFDGRRTSMPARCWNRGNYWLARDGSIELPVVSAVVDCRVNGALPDSLAVRSSAEPLADELERKVAKIFGDVLELPDSIDAASDFFALGGTSLRAAQLCIALGEFADKSYPLSLLLHARTVRQISAAIRQDVGQHALVEDPNGLVILRTGANPPLYLVHAVGGHLVQYAALIDALPKTRPIIGIEAQGVDGKSAPINDAKAMATAYSKWIRRRQAVGPYLLAGHSFGGALAYEIACILTAQGEQAFVAMLDTGFDWPEEGKFSLRRCLVEARFFVAVSYLIAQNYFRERTALAGSANSDHVRRLKQAITAASRTFRPSPSSLKAFLFAARDGLTRNLKRDYGWSRFVRGIDVVDVSGNHVSMLHQPHIKQTAIALETAICRFLEQKE
jgi:thioesterase domain-containing protein/3-oxoacyl-(acyl-carrier-protein) synthase/acyl carrier protein